MKALKCDRCGCFFDPLEENGDMIRFNNPVIKNRNNWENDTCSFLFGKDMVQCIDLCPGCTQDFVYFMSGGNREEELTEVFHEKILKKDQEYNELMSKYLDLCEKNGDFSLKSDEL